MATDDTSSTPVTDGSGSPMPDEVQTIREVYGSLRQLDREAQIRVLRWLTDRLEADDFKRQRTER